MIYLPQKLIRINAYDGSISTVVEFINRFFTNKIQVPTRMGTTHGLFLNANGRIISDAIITATNSTESKNIYIECPDLNLKTLTEHLKFYSEFSEEDIHIETLNHAKVSAVIVQNCKNLMNFSQYSTNFLVIDSRAFSEKIGRVYQLSDDVQWLHNCSVENINRSQYDILRFKNGIPEGPHEIIPEKSLPTQCNYDYLGGIDFEKGCYLGQELTSRTHFVGVTRRRIVPFQISPNNISEHLPKINSEIKFFDCASEVEVGSYLNSESIFGLCMHRKLENFANNTAFCRVDGEKFEVKFTKPHWWP